MRFFGLRRQRSERETLPEGATAPQPERHEQQLPDPGLGDLSGRDWRAVALRALKEARNDEVTDIAAALAYYVFAALPALLLVAVGVFSRTAGPGTVASMMDRLATVAPAEVVSLLRDSLTRVTENAEGGLAMIVVGFVLALWTATGAVNALMRGLNRVYDRRETRGFVKQRATALAVLATLFLAFALTFGLLVLGPFLADRIGALVGLETVFTWIWWTAQWPILVVALLFAFASVLYLGPDVAHPRWRFLTPGSAVAVTTWLLASGLFALYLSGFDSYNKAWGSLAAVIVMLTWLWLTGLALLLGAELNAETERSRELRQGQPAEVELQAPPRG